MALAATQIKKKSKPENYYHGKGRGRRGRCCRGHREAGAAAVVGAGAAAGIEAVSGGVDMAERAGGVDLAAVLGAGGKGGGGARGRGRGRGYSGSGL